MSKFAALVLSFVLAFTTAPAFGLAPSDTSGADDATSLLPAVDLDRPHVEGEAVVLYLPDEQAVGTRSLDGRSVGERAFESDGFEVAQDFDVSVDAATAEENGLGETLGSSDVADALLTAVEEKTALKQEAMQCGMRTASNGGADDALSAEEAAVRAVSKRARIAVVRKQDASTAELIAELSVRDDVLIAEPNYQMVLETGDGLVDQADDGATGDEGTVDFAFDEDSGSSDTAMQPFEASEAKAATSPVPNQQMPDLAYDVTEDPYGADNLWSLVGENGIDFAAAYQELENASPDPVVVAVIDSGVDYTHPDLAPSMWKNPGNIGLPGEHGYDFGCNDADPMPDVERHGTHVAGTIAAACDNRIGVAGVSGGTAQIMALKIADDAHGGATFTDAAIASYQYVLQAKKAGVNVVAANNSWGDWGASLILEYLIDQLGRAGVMSICAAGNSSEDVDATAALSASNSSPYLIAVAASVERGGLAQSSSYGAAGVDVAFPGRNILSTYPASTSRISAASYEPTLAGTAITKPGDEPLDGRGVNYFYTSFANATIDQFTLQSADPDKMPAISFPDGSDHAGYADCSSLQVELPTAVRVTVSFQIENPFFGVEPIPDGVYFGSTGWSGDWSDNNGSIGAIRLSGGVTAGKSTGYGETGSPAMLSVPVTGIDPDEPMIDVSVELRNVAGTHPATYRLGNFGIGRAPAQGVGSYEILSGTSMAAPAASGAFALLAALYGGEGGETALQLRGRLLGSTEKLAAGQPAIATNGRFTFAHALGSDPALLPTAYDVQLVDKALVVSGRALTDSAVILDGIDVTAAVDKAASSDECLELRWDDVAAAFAREGRTAPHDATVPYELQKSGRTFTGRCFIEESAAEDEGGMQLVQLGALPRIGDATASGVLTTDGESLFLFETAGRYLYRCDDIDAGAWTELAAPDDISGTAACAYAYADGKLYRLSNESEPVPHSSYLLYDLRYTLDSYDIASGAWSAKRTVVEQDGVRIDHFASLDATFGSYNGQLVWIRDGSRADQATDPYVVTFYDAATGKQTEVPLPQKTADLSLTFGSRTPFMQVGDKLYLAMYQSDNDGDGLASLYMLAFDGKSWTLEASSAPVPVPVASKASSAATATGDGIVFPNLPMDGTGSMTFYCAVRHSFESLACATNTNDMIGNAVCLGATCYTTASDDDGTGHLCRLPESAAVASNVYSVGAVAGEGGTVRVERGFDSGAPGFGGGAAAEDDVASTLAVQPSLNLSAAQGALAFAMPPSSVSAHVRVGDFVVFTAMPDEGFAFSGWADETGSVVGEGAVFSTRVASDKILSAVFERVGEDPAPTPGGGELDGGTVPGGNSPSSDSLPGSGSMESASGGVLAFAGDFLRPAAILVIFALAVAVLVVCKLGIPSAWRRNRADAPGKHSH